MKVGNGVQFVMEETNGETYKVDGTIRQGCIGEIMRIQRKGEGLASGKGSVGNVNPPLKIETDEPMKNTRKKERISECDCQSSLIW